MKLHLTQAEGNQLITGYSDTAISVNHQAYQHSIIVSATAIYTDWLVSHFDALTTEHFAQIAKLDPEILLLGTGDKQRFVHPRLTVALTEQGIAVECMTTDAACRTYNILMSEGRRVLAALILAAPHA